MATNASNPSPNPGLGRWVENLANFKEHHAKGYPELSFYFSENPRYFHLRRFSALACRVLLYRQHELVMLEDKLLGAENKDASSTDSKRRSYLKNFHNLKDGLAEDSVSYEEQKGLYHDIKHELKEYEEAIIRFDQLWSKECDPIELQFVQRFLSLTEASGDPMCGLDGLVWGSLYSDDTHSHASDLIQVVRRVKPSAIGKTLQIIYLSWVPNMARWLPFFFRRSKDRFGQYPASARACEMFTLALGNIVVSILVYIAVAVMYFTSGIAISASSISISILIPVVVTICSVLFNNAQFISMLATVCAVVATLLMNDKERTGPNQGVTF